MGARPGEHRNPYPRSRTGFGAKPKLRKIQDSVRLQDPPAHMKAMTPVVPPLEQEIREVHQIVKRGKSSYFCVCGKHFSWSNSEQSANLAMEYHRDACLEAVERAQAGESNLLEEGETV